MAETTSIKSKVHADFTEIEIAGVKFEITRGTSDVIVYAPGFEPGIPSKHAAKNVTDPSVIPGADGRSAEVYGAFLEVPENGLPIIATPGTAKAIPTGHAEPAKAPVKKELRIGDKLKDGWICATEPFWESGVKQVILAKPFKDKGLAFYADAENAAKNERSAGIVPNADLPTWDQVYRISRAADKIGLNTKGGLQSTFWTKSRSILPGHRKVYNLTPQHLRENDNPDKDLTVREKGSMYAAFFIGTLKL